MAAASWRSRSALRRTRRRWRRRSATSWRKTLKDGFTPAEVDAAKKSWLQERLRGPLAGRRDGRAARRTRERFDRTMEWDKALEAKVAALTPEQISAAMRKFIDPSQLSYVKAGDFKKAGVLQ